MQIDQMTIRTASKFWCKKETIKVEKRQWKITNYRPEQLPNQDTLRSISLTWRR